MSRDVTLYYDFVSPYSYLAYTQLAALKERTGANILLKPIHVLTVMERVGNTPTTATCKAKGEYARADLARWAVHYKTLLNPHPKFGTFSTEPLLLGALAAESRGQLETFSEAAFEAVWLHQADLENSSAIVDWLSAAGVRDAGEIWAHRQDFKPRLEANLEAAIADGVFGVPSFKTVQNLYFGNDRLSFLSLIHI